MKTRLCISFFVCLLVVSLTGCIRSFTPPNSADVTSYLVVDGMISVGAPVHLKLSRTRGLGEELQPAPEVGAELQLESESGEVYPFVEQDSGVYQASGITEIQKYRLRIHTSDQSEYLSDYVETRISPAIDSIEWEEDNDVFIYVNTHDDLSQTRNYRWEFDETTEYHAVYDSNIEFRDGQLIFLQPDEMRFACFRYYSSNAILIATSGTLGSDVISHFQLTQIPNDNSKISFRYSMLLKQYALTDEAYTYWRIVKQNSEQSGNIFDPQPSQLYGNIRNVSNPSEPVIGFLSASTVSEKRLFIRQSELQEIRYPNNEFCTETFIPPGYETSFLRDGKLLPAYYRMSDGYLAIAPKECVDCRLSGGTTGKPSYW